MTNPVPEAPARGWYADPERPGNERWWTGAEWSDVSVTARPGGLFGIDFVRSMRPGPNSAAGRGILFARIALVPFLGAFVLLFTGTVQGEPLWYSLVGIAALLTIALAIPAIVFAVLGLRRSDALGAKALSINTIVSATLVIVLALVLLMF